MRMDKASAFQNSYFFAKTLIFCVFTQKTVTSRADPSACAHLKSIKNAPDSDPELFRKSIFFSKKREIALDFFENIDILYQK